MAAFIPLNAGGSDAFFFMMARLWWPLCRRHCHIFRDSSSCHVKQQHPGLLILLELSGEGWQPLCAPSLALLMWTLRQISTECHRWIFVELTLPAVCDEQTGSADPLGVAQFPSRAPGVRLPGAGGGAVGVFYLGGVQGEMWKRVMWWFCHEVLVEMSAFVIIAVDMVDAEVKINKKKKSHNQTRLQWSSIETQRLSSLDVSDVHCQSAGADPFLCCCGDSFLEHRCNVTFCVSSSGPAHQFKDSLMEPCDGTELL